jgi:putative transposase
VRFAFIGAEQARHSVAILCRCLRVTRSGFYAWQHRPVSGHAVRDRQLRTLIRTSHESSRRSYGSPRVHADLHAQGIAIRRKRVARLMRQDGLRARVRKRFRVTTMSDHDQPIAANVLARQFAAEHPNQRWVGDTTEFVIGSTAKLYLAAILDLYSRFVVGWAISAVKNELESQDVVEIR